MHRHYHLDEPFFFSFAPQGFLLQLFPKELLGSLTPMHLAVTRGQCLFLEALLTGSLPSARVTSVTPEGLGALSDERGHLVPHLSSSRGHPPAVCPLNTRPQHRAQGILPRSGFQVWTSRYSKSISPHRKCSNNCKGSILTPSSGLAAHKDTAVPAGARHSAALQDWDGLHSGALQN